MQESHFWDDNEKAQKTIGESNALKTWTEPCFQMKKSLDDLAEMFPEAYKDGDPELIAELKGELSRLEAKFGELEIKRMLSGELDNKSCFLTINAGAGGTEACDWAQMLSRMYQRWADDHDWKVEVLDFLDGDVIGYKSITIKITGSFAYGYAKAERGVHRLVRISPFDSGGRRHTSFASVDVTPEVTDDIEIDVRPEEVRIDTYRASGAGGQHVNKTDSAVRITHLPSGIVVCSQQQRSQIQNREACFKMLKSQLYQREVEERELKIKQLAGNKMQIGWGSQIRNYTFQPYTLVKDTRTKVEMGDIQAVMDGDIDLFIIAYLKEYG
jgi:peptide chain release factor 2